MVVGVLANESKPESVEKLIKIVKSFDSDEDNIKAFCLVGSKNYTENLKDYLSDPYVIGIKTALFQPQRPKPNIDYEHLKYLAVLTYNASLKYKKPMQLHVHLDHPFKAGEFLPISEINTGKYDNLGWIDKIVMETGVPYSTFKLTHAQKYYDRIIEYANKGCYIDYTAFNKDYDNRFDSLINAVKENKVDLSKISLSSDLGILTMEYGAKGEEYPSSLLHTMKELIKHGLKFEQVLPMITTNPAKLIGEDIISIKKRSKYPLIILNKDYEIEKIIIFSKFLKNDIFINI